MPKQSVNESETEKNDFSPSSLDQAEDPFASDLFPRSASSEFGDLIQTEDSEFLTEASDDVSLAKDESELWHRELPRLTAAEVEYAHTFLQLPIYLSSIIIEIVNKTLEQYVTNNEVAVQCEVICNEEIDLTSNAIEFSEQNSVFTVIVAQPQEKEAVLIVESAFAANLIKTALVNEVNQEERRTLSNTELAIFEFFALCCLSEINKLLGEPLLRLRKTAQEVPGFLQTDVNNQKGRGLLQTIRLQIGSETSLLKLLLPFDFLQSLNETKNPLLTRQNQKEKVFLLQKIVSGVTLRAALGETDLDIGDLAFLESEDIVVIERPNVQLIKSELIGAIEVFVGDEEQPSLQGVLTTDKNLQFEIREINQKSKSNTVSRINMQENDLATEEQETEGALALEKIAVTVKVEIASRRMNLDELAQIRNGQIIDLECKATDPVELVADGKTIAVGKLVDIEGSLGVKLTKVSLS